MAISSFPARTTRLSQLFESYQPNDKSPKESSKSASEAAAGAVNGIISELSTLASPQSFSRIRDNLTSGNVGSRGEVYFVAQVALILCVLYGTIPMLGDLLTFVLGPCTLLLGIVTAVLGLKDLGASNLSPWPKVPETENASLITNGIYGEVRHPIYAGLLATCLGFSVWTGSAMRVVLTFMLYYLLDLKSDFEEKSLSDKFGNSYVQYQYEVRGKFVPHQLEDVIKKLDTLGTGGGDQKDDKGSGTFQ